MLGILSPAQIETFQRDGLLILRDFYAPSQIEPIQRAIYDIIGLVIDKYRLDIDRAPFAPERFDDGYQAVIKANRKYGAEVYDAVKQIPAFVRLLGDERHEQLVRSVRPGALPGIAHAGSGIRIDNPREEKFRANWHQEYPAQLRSLDGVVFWSPLVEITPEIGPVEFCPGSHVEGPLPVFSADPDNAGKQGAYALLIKDEASYLARYPHVQPLTKPGDLVMVDFLVLHASGHNTSQRSRWSMQFRYFNFCEPTGRSHGWKGSYANGVDFRTVHPELSVEA
ncbi:phytanoyl-CoA dioxygenase family protein [Ralstonia mojiangensis]|uniref:phytanoyl-CoA dioxygenase family protein n=1 Tax=Ralstonia mojiangensis TaxID=2953895 RepID=UPI0021B21D93|nr:phytanoyl-CoA dioxygenase family protein [Ralstonia mojiangensis]MCT7328561.1 phytanoyl-CoA dioxygenase family protein [Ralstonia mojiangensis]